MISKNKILYISYDGILDPIGESQVLSYLELLSKDYSFTLITFEKKKYLKDKLKFIDINKRIIESNINWIYFKYDLLPKPLSYFYNIIICFITPLYLILFNNIKLVHIRSYAPGICIYFLKKIIKFNLLFDIRGFWVDERVDRHNWKKKQFKYKFFKYLEKKLFQTSESIICLTHHSKKIISQLFLNTENKITVIPTCVDDKFFFLSDKLKKKNDKIIFGYLGTTGSAYDIRKVIKFFSYFLNKNQNSQLKIFTSDSKNRLKKYFEDFNINKKYFTIHNVKRNMLNDELNNIDLGIFYVKENFSILGSFPTKIGEFLMSGVPIVCNNFNNDIYNLISKYKIGLLYNFEENDFEKKYHNIIEIIKSKKIKSVCYETSKKLFSIQRGVREYNNIYKKLINNIYE